ncbi:MAG: cation:proton antiporter, partial [Pseudomonadota bacterium]
MDNLIYIVALIGLLGVGAQWLAWRYHLPAIVLMSAAGLIAGPGLGLIQPEEDFGELLSPMIKVAVAIILFEGGLSLNYAEVRGHIKSVRRLVFPGVPIGWGLGTVAAHYLAGLSWPVAALFAGILIVTGPTVIAPLLRQAKLKQRPASILRWEGIVNDPIGALLAVFVFQIMVLMNEGG